MSLFVFSLSYQLTYRLDLSVPALTLMDLDRDGRQPYLQSAERQPGKWEAHGRIRKARFRCTYFYGFVFLATVEYCWRASVFVWIPKFINVLTRYVMCLLLVSLKFDDVCVLVFWYSYDVLLLFINKFNVHIISWERSCFIPSILMMITSIVTDSLSELTRIYCINWD